MSSSYFVDKAPIGFRYFADCERWRTTGWRPTALWANRAARRRIRVAIRNMQRKARARSARS
jgi:hypothetical protein